jgi:hypothetical protein
MLKLLSAATVATVLIAGTAFAQTTPGQTMPPPEKQDKAGSGSRALTPADKSNEPVMPGTSSVPTGPNKQPTDAQKKLDTPSAGGGGK